MRQAGSIATKQDAARLGAYLIAQGIDVVAEPDGSQWALWVRDEDMIARAREEIALYTADPQNARYDGAERAAAERQKQEAERRAQAQKNVRHMSGQWSDGRLKTGPLTRVVILLCVLIFALTDFGNAKNGQVYATLTFIEVRTEKLQQILSQEEIAKANAEHSLPPLVSIRHGELWRLITPIFLHGGWVHIVFNLMMFHSLASVIEIRRGTGRLALVILGTALVSNLGQALMPLQWGGTPHFVGISGVVYGLLGFAWMKSRYQPHLGIYVPKDVVVSCLVWLVVCWLFRNQMHVANWSHAFGLLAGVLFGLLPTKRSSQRI